MCVFERERVVAVAVAVVVGGGGRGGVVGAGVKLLVCEALMVGAGVGRSYR